jgi:hypothetical protein
MTSPVLPPRNEFHKMRNSCNLLEISEMWSVSNFLEACFLMFGDPGD